MPPSSHNQCHNKLTETHQKFVDEALLNLLTNRCIRRMEAEPWLCSPLSVVSNSTGELHSFKLAVCKSIFACDQIQVWRLASGYINVWEMMFKFDLKSGCHHVNIHCEYQKHLGFRWDTEGCPQVYMFTMLPFRLSTAYYVFTKLLGPMISHWRERGFNF